MKRCPECGFGAVRSVQADEKLQVGTRIFTRSLPGKRCEKCGATYTAARDLAVLEMAAASEIIESGEVSPESFRFLRKVLGMRAQDLAPLLQIAPENLSKWENGHARVPPTAWVLLAEMVVAKRDGRGMTEKLLKRAASPKPLPQAVRLASKHAA